MLAESAPLPPEDGVGGHDQEGLPPPGPDPGEPDPEETISRAKLGPGRRSLVHGELVTQGAVLQGELALAATQEGEETKQVEQKGDHRTEILSGSDLTHQPLSPGRGFGEGQDGAEEVQKPITRITAAPRHPAWRLSRDSTGSAVEAVREVQTGQAELLDPESLRVACVILGRRHDVNLVAPTDRAAEAEEAACDTPISAECPRSP